MADTTTTSSSQTVTENAPLTTADMLAEVNNAIYAVLIGGQSYKIGSRNLTRADLSMLRTLKNELTAELNAQGSSSLLDNTYVAVFTDTR